MPIFACGINYKTAPLLLREKVFFAQDKLPIYLQDLAAQEEILGAVLLSTCNRSELYCDANSAQQVMEWFCQQHRVPQSELMPVLYIYEGQEAVEHIMRVACGLDSMVLGESQILGQMKDAFSESCAAGTVNALFNRLFQHVFAVAKEVRTTTAIGACPVSISSAAVNFLKQKLPMPFEQMSLVLVGAGLSVDLVLRYLRESLPKRTVIVNRSVQNAEKLANKYAVETARLSQLPALLQQADVVIAATGSVLPIITQKMLLGRERPIWMVDLAVPRDIELSVAECPFAHLFSIDDLKESIQQNLSNREHAAEKANEVVKQKSQEFIAWLHSFQIIATTIRAYRKQIEDICSNELTKATQQLHCGEDPAQVLVNFAHGLTNKLLHAPSVQLRQAGNEGRHEMLEWAQYLFALPSSRIG